MPVDAMRGYLRDLRRLALAVLAFARHVLARFQDAGCFGAAGALSYTTLVSLVPLLAISLAILSAFPIFDKLRGDALSVVFDAFVPRVGGTVEYYISSFAATAGKTTAVGIAVLAVTAIMLLTTIETRLDAIWRVNRPRHWLARLAVYWTVLTLGPLLFGVALSLTTSLHGLPQSLGLSRETVQHFGPDLGWVSHLIPVCFEAIALCLCYCLIPHTPVRWHEGLTGGIVAALLFEACKAGFSYYLDHFSSYQAVYGALAAIPAFLLWMYLSWSVILFGAVVAAELPLWSADPALAGAMDLAGFELALAILELLSAARVTGKPVASGRLARQLQCPSWAVMDCLMHLETGGFVAAIPESGWMLARDLGTVSLLDLQQTLRPQAGEGPPPGLHRAEVYRALTQCLEPVRAAEIQALSVPIASVIPLNRV